MARFKGIDWNLREISPNQIATWEQAQLAVLMDIRDELQQLNRIIGCPNFIGIPFTLRSIDRKVTKPKRKRKRATK